LASLHVAAVMWVEPWHDAGAHWAADVHCTHPLVGEHALEHTVSTATQIFAALHVARAA